MHSLASAVAAPEPVRIGDKSFDASPLDLFQLGALERVVRAEYIHDAVAGVQGHPPVLREEVVRTALREAAKITFGSQQMSEFLASYQGGCHLIALSLRARHPDVTPAAVGAMFSRHMDQFAAAFEVVNRISGFTREDAADTGEARAAETAPPT